MGNLVTDRRTVLGAGLASLLPAGMAAAQSKSKVYAMVPKLVGVPFYTDVETGCKEEAKKLGVECLFTGSTQVDEAEQVRVFRDLITRGVAGIAVAPNNPESMASAIAAAQAKGIAVVTFDSDAPNSKRTAFVGTNNQAGGEMGGKAFAAALPNGGTYAIITGGLAAINLNERIAGFKSQLGGNFKEVAGSPLPCEDDSGRGVQLIQDVLAKNPNLSGLFLSGGWPMFAPEAFRRALRSKAEDIKSGKFALIAFDVQEPQLRLLKDGYATALVGQRPVAMGQQSMIALTKLAAGETIPKTIDTGVDLVDAKTVDKFMTK